MVVDGAPLVEEPLQVTRLVLVPFPPNELRVRVVPVRPLELLPSDGKLKRGQVRAREEPVEVGGREEKPVAISSHLPRHVGPEQVGPDAQGQSGLEDGVGYIRPVSGHGAWLDS